MNGPFSHFTEHQVAQLNRCASLKQFEAGSQILKEGATTLDVYYVKQGQVRLQRQTPYGEFTVTTLSTGELFGELSYVDGEARSIDVFADTATEILIFNPDALTQLAQDDSAFNVALYWAFWKSLSGKLRQTNETLASFFSGAPKGPSMASFLGHRSSGEVQVDMKTKRTLFQEQKLSTLEINLLASLSKAKKLKPGQTIFRDGDDAYLMYVILEGRIMISKEIPGAGEEALAFLERGDFFGEMALIDQVPRSADAKADKEGAVVLTISREVLETILDIKKVSSVTLLSTLCSRLAKRLREVTEKIIGWYILSGGTQGAVGRQ